MPETNKNDFKSENDNILLNLKKSDIKSGFEYKKDKKVFPKIVKILLYIIFTVILAWGIFKIFFGFFSYNKAQNIYDEIRNSFYSGNFSSQNGYMHKVTAVPEKQILLDDDSAVNIVEPTNEEYALMMSNVEMLKSINSHTVGWIKIDGTRVDYPFFQGYDNEFYLTHGPDRAYLVSGSIFLDCNNSKRPDKNKNTCIYGHNMNDGTMFQTIMNFKDVRIFNSCKIELYTSHGTFIYEPFSAYEAMPDYYFFKTDFASDEDFSSFLEEMKSNSMHKSALELTAEDKIITLMTCTNTALNKRFVVQAKLVEIKE